MPYLSEVLLAAGGREGLERVLRVLLSPSELERLEKRCLAISFLSEGYSHREVRDTIAVSIATVSRASRMIDGEDGRFVADLINEVKAGISD